MLRTIVDVFELGDGSIVIDMQTDRFRPKDHATELEMKTCNAIHAVLGSLETQPVAIKYFEGWRAGVKLSPDAPVCVEV